jgi:hypothetical protein
MAEEDILFREYLIENGFDVSKMGSEVDIVSAAEVAVDEKAEDKARL